MWVNWKSLCEKGYKALEKGNYKKAVELLDRALEIEKKSEMIWYYKGNALFETKEYEAAIECYKEALRLNDNSCQIWNNAGNAAQAAGRYKEALNCYNNALTLNPMDALSWANKGNVLVADNRKEEALSCYDKALELNSRMESVLYNKGILLNQLGRCEESKKVLQEYLQAFPSGELERIGKAKEILSGMGATEYDNAGNGIARFLNRKCIISIIPLNNTGEQYGIQNGSIEIKGNNFIVLGNAGKEFYKCSMDKVKIEKDSGTMLHLRCKGASYDTQITIINWMGV